MIDFIFFTIVVSLAAHAQATADSLLQRAERLAKDQGEAQYWRRAYVFDRTAGGDLFERQKRQNLAWSLTEQTAADLQTFSEEVLQIWRSNQFPLYLESENLRPEVGFINSSVDNLDVIDWFTSADLQGFLSPIKTIDSINDFKLIDNPIESFNAKVELLTRRDLKSKGFVPNELFPDLNADELPEVDTIVVSSLYLLNDYFGSNLARFIEMYASRGTKVYILVSEVTDETSLKSPSSIDKNEKFLESLAAKSPNIFLRRYRNYQTEYEMGLPRIDVFHRINHIKLLAVYSKKQPSISRMILGGRNAIDTEHLYPCDANVRHAPLLDCQDTTNYRPSWDLEVLVRNQSLVQSAIRQFLAFWDESSSRRPVSPALFVRVPPNEAIPLPLDNSEVTYARYFQSLPMEPFAHDNLEFFLKLFRTAKSEIVIVTRYFHLPEEMTDLFNQLIRKGVRIKWVSQVFVEEDDYRPEAIERLNLETVSALDDNFQICKVKRVIKKIGNNSINYALPMHAKALVIDGKLAFVGAFNFNRRSFYHDSENGMFFIGKKAVANLLAMIDQKTDPCKRRQDFAAQLTDRPQLDIVSRFELLLIRDWF